MISCDVKLPPLVKVDFPPAFLAVSFPRELFESLMKSCHDSSSGSSIQETLKGL